jgi:hypothetical protein
MVTRTIEAGTLVEARTAYGNVVRRRALGPASMSDFLIFRLATEDEWVAAQNEGREPDWTPWPAEDVWAVE